MWLEINVGFVQLIRNYVVKNKFDVLILSIFFANNRNPLNKNIYTSLVLMYYFSSFQILAPAPIKLIEDSSLVSLCFCLCMHVSAPYKHKSAHTSKQ